MGEEKTCGECGRSQGKRARRKGERKKEELFKAMVSERLKEQAESGGPQMRYVGRQGVGALQAACCVHTALLLSVTNSLGSIKKL